jgi:hypothetical protein
MGYAKWTAYRLPYLVPRTALKAKLGFTSVEAVLFDVIPRVTLDPYMTNWTRIYAKEGLWWTSLPEAIEAADAANDPDKLLEFLSDPRDVVFAGTKSERELPLTANGIDSWNRNQPPMKYVFEPFMDRMSPYSPVVDTFADGYRLLADNLMKDKLDPNNAAAMDLLIDEMISDVREEWTQIADNRRTPTQQDQTRMEHAEVMGALAFAVNHNRPSRFPETMANHREWFLSVLGKERPVTARDVALYATRFGEYTLIGNEGRSQGFRLDVPEREGKVSYLYDGEVMQEE